MLDLNLIRRDPDYVKNGLAKRGYDADFTELLKWDERASRSFWPKTRASRPSATSINKQIPALQASRVRTCRAAAGASSKDHG